MDLRIVKKLWAAVGTAASRRSFAAFAVFTHWGAERLAAQDTVTAFVHVSVISMDSNRADHHVWQTLEDQTVLVRGDRIIAMGSAPRIEITPGSRQIDGRGKFLMPGLVDMHAHLTMGGWLEEQDTTSLHVTPRIPSFATWRLE